MVKDKTRDSNFIKEEGNVMKQENFIKRIKRIKIDTKYQYDIETLYDEKIGFMVKNCKNVLDIGKSSRSRFKWFKKEQITTLDINEYDDYPDILDDICDLKSLEPESFDAIICNAILEHVYSPESAINNLYSILRNGCYILAYIPFLWRYHAPDDLYFQDFYRFTKDGIAYLFRNFSDVTLFPVRGEYSTILNIHKDWKRRIERKFGQKLNLLIDRIFRSKNEKVQVSGYVVWAKKQI